MAESKQKSFGCLPFLRRKLSCRTPTPAPAPPGACNAMQRSKSTDSLASITSIDGNRSSLDSFAKLYVRRRNSNRERSERATTCLRATKLVMEPYFGPFAGQRVVFDLRKTESGVVSLKVKTGDEVLSTLSHRPGRKDTVKDQCLKFAHEMTSKTSTAQPSSLVFLCEQALLLHQNELPVHLLPQRYTESLLNSCTQKVSIRLWPCSVHHNQLVTLKLKPRISVLELQWMLCKRVGLTNPSALSLYLRDAIVPLSSTSPLPEDCSELECIVSTSQQQSEKTICVSIIGRGMKEVSVTSLMTLYQFEQAVKNTFNLHPDSFLYLPQVDSNSRTSLKMHAVLDDDNSSIYLLDEDRRNFPTLYGFVSVCEPQTLQSLLLYQTTICELDLFKSGLVIGFEVTGPTVPISFKTMQTHRSTEDVSNQDTRNSIFSVIAIKPHAVSVNPDWSVSVLLKYITCISGFPCKSMHLGQKCLDEALVSDIFCRTWFSVDSKKNTLSLATEIPEAIPG